MNDFRTYITQSGFGLERTAKLTNSKVPITKLVVGEGVLGPELSPANQTDLIHQVKEYAVTIEADPIDPEIWIARAEIPADEGGFSINEAGIKTDAGDLYCYARLPGDYKPLLSEGAGKSYTIRLKFKPGNASTIEIKIDPSVQFATPTDLKNTMSAHDKDKNPHEQYVLKEEVLSETQSAIRACVNTTAQIHNMRRSLTCLALYY